MMIDRDTYYRQHRTRTFIDIMNEPNDPDPASEGKTGYAYFEWKVNHCGIPLSSRLLTGTGYTAYNLEAIYYLLMSYYYNNAIASNDENRFMMELTTILFQHAPEWQRMTKLQDDLLKLTNDDLVAGSVQIHNYADHPDTDPDTKFGDQLPYITNQTTNLYQNDKVNAYTKLMPWIEMDTTKKFIDHFKKLFTIFAYDYKPLLFEQD